MKIKFNFRKNALIIGFIWEFSYFAKYIDIYLPFIIIQINLGV